MQAIIFADRLGAELSPLCEHTPPALLPLANRPLMEYTLDDLAGVGVSEALVFTTQPRQLQQHFAHGEMWGIKLRYLLSRGEEHPSEVVRRNRSLLSFPLLALRGDMLRSPACQSLLHSAEGSSSHLLFAGQHSGAIYLQHLSESGEELSALNWHPADEPTSPTHRVEISDGVVSRLDSFHAFYQATEQLLEGEYGLHTATVQQVDVGVHVGPNGEVSPLSREEGRILVGKQSRVEPQVRLLGPTVIGDHCFIDNGSTLVRSIILPGSYVGAGLQIENAIISGHHLIRIDRDSVITVSDPAVLAYVDHEVESLLLTLPDRLLGSLLLLASLPLWPVAFLLSLLADHHQPLRLITLLSNRCAPQSPSRERVLVEGWQMATTVPLLRHLPMLWLVVRGDLLLFGSTPLQPARDEAAATPPCWDLRYQTTRAGLLGPAQLSLPHNAPEEERQLNESQFIFDSGIGALVSRLLRAAVLLFSTRAWLSRPAQLPGE